MLRTNRFVLAMVLATLAVALPPAAQARPKIPGIKSGNCLINGTVVPNGETLTVIDDENCAIATHYCTNGEVCGFIKWEAQCGGEDFGEEKVIADQCHMSPAPAQMVTPVTQTWTSTTPTTSLVPSANLSPWY